MQPRGSQTATNENGFQARFRQTTCRGTGFSEVAVYDSHPISRTWYLCWSLSVFLILLACIIAPFDPVMGAELIVIGILIFIVASYHNGEISNETGIFLQEPFLGYC